MVLYDESSSAKDIEYCFGCVTIFEEEAQKQTKRISKERLEKEANQYIVFALAQKSILNTY